MQPIADLPLGRRLLRAREVAEFLDMSEQAVFRLTRERKLPVVEIGEEVGRDREIVRVAAFAFDDDIAAAGRDRIDGIAGGRRQHEVGRRQRCGPIAALVEAAYGLVNFAFGAVQAADAAEQVGKALQIARLLQLVAAHDRGKPQHFRGGLAVARDKSRQALDHLFVERSTSVDAVDAHRPEQRRGERFERIARLRGGFPRRVADVHAARPALRS